MWRTSCGDGGVFQVNHPAEGATADQLDWKYAYAVVPDTVEAWNISPLYQPPLPSASDNDGAIRYWEGWLDRGSKVAATGGSDNHYLATTAIQGAGQPTTWVAVRRRRTVAGVSRACARAARSSPTSRPPMEAGACSWRPIATATGATRRSPAARCASSAGAAPACACESMGRPAPSCGSCDAGILPFEPVTITSPRFSHRFTLPAGARWVRAEVVGDGRFLEVRKQVCDSPLGAETTYCRNAIARLALSSAIYLR